MPLCFDTERSLLIYYAISVRVSTQRNDDVRGTLKARVALGRIEGKGIKENEGICKHSVLVGTGGACSRKASIRMC